MIFYFIWRVRSHIDGIAWCNRRCFGERVVKGPVGYCLTGEIHARGIESGHFGIGSVDPNDRIDKPSGSLSVVVVHERLLLLAGDYVARVEHVGYRICCAEARCYFGHFRVVERRIVGHVAYAQHRHEFTLNEVFIAVEFCCMIAADHIVEIRAVGNCEARDIEHAEVLAIALGENLPVDFIGHYSYFTGGIGGPERGV